MRNLKNISILVLLFVLAISACRKPEPLDPDVPVYSSYDNIVNPPEEFKVLYNLRSELNYTTTIKFQDSSVWLIEKQNSFSVLFWIERQYNNDSTGQYYIPENTVVGLEGGREYDFYANKNNYPEERKFTVLFKKTDYNYDTYEPKF